MKNKGTVVALILILISGIGLYAAWMNRDLPEQPLPMPSTSGVVAVGGGAATKTAVSVTAPRRTQTPKTSVPSKGSYGYNYPGVTPAVAVLNAKEWALLLVNRAFALPADFSIETAVCVTVYPENIQLDARVAPEFRKMYNAAQKDGVELIPFSGYRRISTQKKNFDDKIAEYVGEGMSLAEAVSKAAESILPPGCSEHEAGLAIDLTRKGVWATRMDFATTKEFAWLQAHAAEYGFILRYPEGKEGITKVKYEPWHWRYVGKEAALAMKTSGQCLEEYAG
ncbi:MAG: M15 family metallopeptidase [Oscillospiraceae bacterium]|jgi:D-alanyl-D-alanine carboxypeptidase|nr:M15 family metallopeptidase [Oscillospiraceae bacterium]